MGTVVEEGGGGEVVVEGAVRGAAGGGKSDRRVRGYWSRGAGAREARSRERVEHGASQRAGKGQ